jgi:DNA-binding Lrp family transcriptional regulator
MVLLQEKEEPKMNTTENEIDMKILAAIQDDFPISKRPFSDIANNLGVSEDEVIVMIKKLRESGMIRKMGAVINPKKMGYVSILAAISVSEDKIDSVAEIINEYPGVTHNYLREGDPNIWFTLTEPDTETLEFNLKNIEERIGIGIMRMPMTKKYKIGVKLDI